MGKTVYAGKCKEVKKYYSRRHKPKEKRIKREEPTRETQENVNIRKQTEQLRWKLNCNFQEGDMFVTFSYKKEERPDTYEDLVKQKNKLIADLRKEYKKQERDAKYIYVLENRKQRCKAYPYGPGKHRAKSNQKMLGPWENRYSAT